MQSVFVLSNTLQAMFAGHSVKYVYILLNCLLEGNMNNGAPLVHLHLKSVLSIAVLGH